MKINELTGEQLSYWVAKAQGWRPSNKPQGITTNVMFWVDTNSQEVAIVNNYRPDQDKTQAFELIEKFKLTVEPSNMDAWWAYYLKGDELEAQRGSTLEVAICRAVVASVYGEEVKDV